METATVDGITSTSASESEAQILDALSTDETGALPEGGAAPAVQADAPKPKKESYQARIDRLTADVGNKDQALSTLNAKLAQMDVLERKLAALEARPAAEQERPAPRQPQPSYTRAKPSEDEVGEKYDKYSDYIEDLTDWKSEQREAQQAQRHQAESRQQTESTRQQAFSERLTAARTANPDFQAVLDSPVRLSLPMQDVIKDSAIGPQVMTYLHEHQDEAERIYRAGSQLRVFAEMNKLEARLEAAVDRGPAPKAKPVSQAKPPIKPLGAASSVTSDSEPGDDASTEDHLRYWDAKEAAQARQGR